MNMKKKIVSLTISAAFLLAPTCVQGSYAASWRIHNNANRYAHFTDINAAMSSSEVQDGDTLYIDSGCTLGTQTVSKRVTIIGPGYSLPEGAGYQGDAIVGELNLNVAGIKVMGLTARTNSTTWNVKAANITIERCSASHIYITSQHTTIRQCVGRSFRGNNSMTSAFCTVENCIFTINSRDVPIKSLYNATVRNNYLRNSNTGSTYCMTDMNNSIIENNIMLHVNKSDKLFNNISSCVFSRNVLSCAEGTYAYVDTENNLQLGEAKEANIFTLEGTAMRNYQLKDGSPAKGYATDGGDCGPYGGTHPYIPCGYPLGMPRFVSGSASDHPEDGIVTVSNQVSIQNQ